MTENGENVAAALNDQENVELHNVSAYDAITEVLSHGIKHFQRVDEFFKDNVGNKGYGTGVRFCYPTALLKYAKTGPCEEAYKLRTDILKEITDDDLQSFTDEPYFYKLYELLDDLNIAYPFIYKSKFCFDCGLQLCHNIRSLHLLSLSRNTCIWKNYSILQPMLDRYFARKTKQCCQCRENYEYYYVNPGALLCIEVETLYEKLYENFGLHPLTNSEVMLLVACSKMLTNSLDALPKRLTVQRSTYVLYGVIERLSKGTQRNEEKHYVAYCRNLDDTWERRDGFDGEKNLLTDLAVDSIAMVFYADIGCWNESERKLLLEPARTAWYKLTNVKLPQLCLEKIFNFLDNWQLKAFIRKSEEKTSGCVFVSSSSSETEEDDMSVVSLRSDSPEYREQDRRSRNVLIHNLPVGDDISDIDRVKSLLLLLPANSYIDLDNILVRRYREVLKNEEFPITVVTFQNEVEADWCIRKRRKLTSIGIKIRGDYTDWQRSQLEKLKVKAWKHNKKYPNDQKAAIMKSGVPVLVRKRNHPGVKAESSTIAVGCSGDSENRVDVTDEKKE